LECPCTDFDAAADSCIFSWLIFQAIAVFLITIHAYANEKSEMEELSMVALSGSIWLQAFVVTLEMK
jgi:phospholipid-translocating ATPase